MEKLLYTTELPSTLDRVNDLREMDKLLALRIGYYVEYEDERYRLVDDEGKSSLQSYSDLFRAWDNVPCFSTDYKATFTLITKWRIGLKIASTADSWECHIKDDDNVYTGHSHLTPLIAICRAIYKANVQELRVILEIRKLHAEIYERQRRLYYWRTK